MSDPNRNAPCPCGSGKKYKACHGASHAAASPTPVGGGPAGPVDNPFRRIFRPDGSVDQEYILSRLEHLETLLGQSERFLGIRYDRDGLERMLAENGDLFQAAKGQEAFEDAFRTFAERALTVLVTEEFDAHAKETLREAVQDPELTRRDRAAAACGLVLTLPSDGEAPQPHHQNPFFDLVLRVTYNESVARAEFLAKLDEEDLSEMEREAKIQEFLRQVPALNHELQKGFQALMRKALGSYERGEYSFGIGMDMILHGIRAIRRETQRYQEEEGDAYTDTQKQEFAERFGAALRDAFAEDVGEEEEREIFSRMIGFLQGARTAGAKKAAKGLSSALTIMEHNAEIRHRLLLAAYHEAVTGSRIFRSEEEDETAAKLFSEPFDVESYTNYGAYLEEAEELTRAERVYRAAMEFFPDHEGVREQLAAVGEALEPARAEEFRRMQAEWQAAEEE